MRNIRLLLQYEGSRYQGWQRQKSSDNTIQGKLEALLFRMCGEEIELHASGRTDAGVHAKGQVANFHTNCAMDVGEMKDYMKQYLPEDIVVKDLSEAGPRFHSRLNAIGKKYRYLVMDGEVPDVFLRRFALHHPEQLDMDAMRRAADRLLGEHDFKAFTSTKKNKKSTVRRIDSIEIEKKENVIAFTFCGNGFLYHMVRIMMGTILEVGRGERSLESIDELFVSGKREEAGYLVPAKGLTLVEVYYHRENLG